MTDSDRTRTPKDDPRPTPEADRGDILREHRARSIEVDWDMLLARGQDAERTPGRKPHIWALLTVGFWAAVVVVLAFAVARC